MMNRTPDLQRVRQTTDEGEEKYRTIAGKEIFLIIGNSGLRDKISKRMSYLVGNNVEVNTDQPLTHPELYQTSEGINLCECPDFIYHTNIEIKLCQSMAIELVTNIAKKIPGLIIVIDYNDFYTCRGTAYRDLTNILGKLSGSQFGLLFQSSVFVVVNKPAKSAVDFKPRILSTLEGIISDYAQENDSHPNMHLEFSRLLVAHSNQLVILDESDHGESRAEIFSALYNVIPVNSSTLDFDAFYHDLMRGLQFNIRQYINDTIKGHAALQKTFEIPHL